MPTFARIKHDTKARNNGLAIYPETVPLQNASGETGKGVLIPYPENWETWTYRLNSPEGGNWLFSVGSMLFNKDYIDEPLAESITNGGNVVSILETTPTHARLKTYRNNLPVPLDGLSFKNRPYLIHKVVCIKGSTLQLYNPSVGLDVYFPLLTKGDNEMWLPLDRLEMFPELGMLVSPVENDFPSYYSPSTESRQHSVYQSSDKFEILDYRLSGCNVWGRIGEREWVILQRNKSFYTSWRMSTQPPIPPMPNVS